MVSSAYEGTKAGHPDEFDFDVVLTEFTDVCEVSSSPMCPSGYVLLRRKRSVHRNGCDFDAFFDDEGFLLTSILRQAFEKCAKTFLRHSALWGDEEDFEVIIIIERDNELYRSRPDRVCLTLKLTSNELINGHIFHPLHLDIVPCIDIKPDDVERAVRDGLK